MCVCLCVHGFVENVGVNRQSLCVVLLYCIVLYSTVVYGFVICAVFFCRLLIEKWVLTDGACGLWVVLLCCIVYCAPS